MRLFSLWLQHFRSYTDQSFSFEPSTSLIVGENARGKTNILEAISLISTGQSFRAQKIEEMVQWGNEVGRVKGKIENSHSRNDSVEVEAILTTGMVQGERTHKRKFTVDGAPKQKKDVIGLLSSVLFRPEDMDLITGSPSLRRRYMDAALSQSDAEYRDSLEAYEKALLRRNALLDVLREGNTTRASFAFWDQMLIKHGNIITEKRREFLSFLHEHTAYPMKFRIEYDSSAISEHRLHQYAVEEVAAGYTLVGPHKDDFVVYMENGARTEGKELSSFGSRGEQRMAVLWLKLGELTFIEKRVGERPILLLDDIFSELDEKHQEMVLQIIEAQQTIIASTEATLPQTLRKGVELIQI